MNLAFYKIQNDDIQYAWAYQESLVHFTYLIRSFNHFPWRHKKWSEKNNQKGA